MSIISVAVLLISVCLVQCSDRYTDMSITNPQWMTTFDQLYQNGKITARPSDIKIVRAIKHHHYVFLQGGFDVMIFTLQVNGHAPCNFTYPPFLDGCGILTHPTSHQL